MTHRHYTASWRRCRDCGRVANDWGDYCDDCSDRLDAENDAQVAQDEREAAEADSVPRAFPCTCRTPIAHATDIDPPEPILDRYCPQHGDGGSDPDAVREDRLEQIREYEREEAAERAYEREHGPRHTDAIQDDPDFPGWADNH